MLTREQVLQALNGFIEPQYQQSITRLNFVRDILIKEDSVSLTLIVTSQDENYKKSV